MMIEIALLHGQRSVPDEAHAADRTGQKIFLLRSGFETVAHGFANQHGV